MKKTTDLTGKVFKYLTVISLHKCSGKQRWLCKCKCGASKIIYGMSLKSGATKSCGCYRKELRTIHGDKFSKEYKTYRNIKNRCYNILTKDYKHYGGRGIKMCKRWLMSYKNFILDMGRAPTPKHTVERINNNKGYYPSNCRWATMLEQANNKRSNVIISYLGRKQNITQWANELGLSSAKIRYRFMNKICLDKIERV